MTKNFLGYFLGSHKDNTKESSAEAQIAASRFDPDEIHVLKKTWQDLADRSNGKGVDKETFLQYFPLNGLLGERLFAQFDTRNQGYIDCDGFITGLSKVCRGSIDDKIHFLFDMYDVSHDKTVSKAELSTLLNHIPKDFFLMYNQGNSPLYSAPSRSQSISNAHYDYPASRSQSISNPNYEYRDDHSSDSNDAANSSHLDNFNDSLNLEDELDMYTNHYMAEKAFEECDLTHEGRLTYEAFKMWVQRTPLIMDYIESILPYNGPKDMQPHHDKRESLPHMKRITSKATLSNRNNLSLNIHDLAGDIFNHSTTPNSNRGRVNSLNMNRLVRQSSLGNAGVHESANNSLGGNSPIVRNASFERGRERTISAADSQSDSEDQVRLHLQQAMDLTKDENLKNSIASLLDLGTITVQRTDTLEVYRTVVSLEGYLWKKGKSLFHMLSKRYYLLSGNCMYYYTHNKDVRPRGVIFLTGSIIERVKEEDMAMKGYYGFELLHQDLCTGEHHRHEKRVLYCKSE